MRRLAILVCLTALALMMPSLSRRRRTVYDTTTARLVERLRLPEMGLCCLKLFIPRGKWTAKHESACASLPRCTSDKSSSTPSVTPIRCACDERGGGGTRTIWWAAANMSSADSAEPCPCWRLPRHGQYGSQTVWQ